MITKWGKEIINCNCSQNQYPNCLYSANITSITAKDYSGTSGYISPTAVSQQPSNTLLTSVGASSNGYVLGKGTTAPTENDYTLDNMITSGISGSISNEIAVNTETGARTIIAVITVNNTTAEPITISEIGYFESHYRSNELGTAYNSNLSRICCLMFREVLDDPIIIAGNDSGVIRLEMIYNDVSG